MFKKLSEIDSEIGNEMLVALRRPPYIRRAQQRYGIAHEVFSELLYSPCNYDEFCYSNKSEIVSKTKDTMQHLFGVQSSANTKTSATIIPAANTSSAELCSIATDDMTLSNEL
jgi:hypothetical protein